jgi:predicted RNase H-like nuclease
MRYSTRKAQGRKERQRLVLLCYPAVKKHIEELDRTQARAHDLLDAAAAAYTGERIVKGDARRIPETLVADSKGLKMEMWF